MSKDKEQDGGGSREAKIERDTRKAMNSSNGGLYHKVTNSGQKRHDPGSLQQVVKNDTFCGNNRGDISKRLSKLFRNNVWKLHGLLESVVSDRELQFAAELMKEVNKMLGIETRLSIAFYPQMDRQTE